MSDNIPHEIQLEIIKKASDVKSLIRFRAVSNPWKSFIDSSEFIACYGVRHTQPHRFLLRYKDVFCPHEFKYISCIDDLTSHQDFAPNVSDLVKQLEYSRVICTSCGLWCLRGFDGSETEMVVIWNPSIRKSVGIVMPRLLNTTSEKMTHFGFGVCPSTYDPTIVAMSRCWKMSEAWQVGVFTLSSKAWKMIPSSNVPRESIELNVNTKVVATDGFVSWLAYDCIDADDGVSQYKSLILSFDLITLEFKEAYLPSGILNQIKRYISISKLNESLVVSGYTNEVNGLVFGVWTMGEEGGVTTSFTKLFNIKTPDDSFVSKVIGFTMRGEPIMETEKKDEHFAALEVYEPCSEHISNIWRCGEHGKFFVCPYTESLLLIDHSDGCIISNDYLG